MDNTQKIIWQAKYLSKRNWLQAVRILREEIKNNADSSELHDLLGDIYFRHKLYSKAVSSYQMALRNNKHENRLLFKLGNSFLSLNEYVLAIDKFEKITDTFPELLYNMAYGYAKIGNLEKSISILKRLIKINKISQVPYIFLAEIYYTQSKFDLALKYLIDAERMFGKQGTISYLQGLAYTNLKNWLKAFIEFDNAEKLNISSHQFYHSYGLTCEKIGKIERAILYIKKSISINPSSAACYLDLIRIYLEHDRLTDAYTLITQAKQKVPFSVPLSILYNQVMQKVNIENRKEEDYE